MKYYLWLDSDKTLVENKYGVKLADKQWQWINGICFVKGRIVG